MQVNVRHSPAYAIAYCSLRAGECMRAESGAMAAMSGGIEVKADAGPGGITKGLMRKTLGGEGFFMTRFTAVVHGAWVAVASNFPGDIKTVEVDPGRALIAESGSVLAIGEDVSLDVRWGGLRNIAMREGATMLRAAGRGKVLLAVYGGIEEIPLAEDQTMVFDTGHLVAFQEGMAVKVGPLSGLITAKLSGEGLVAEITGPGNVYIQTRAAIDLRSWLMPDRTRTRKGPGA